jgi:hypothetical protein
VIWTIICLCYRADVFGVTEVRDRRGRVAAGGIDAASLHTHPVHTTGLCSIACAPMPRIGSRPSIYALVQSKTATLLVAPMAPLHHLICHVVIRHVPARIFEKSQCDLRYKFWCQCCHSHRRHELILEQPLLPVRANDDTCRCGLVLKLGTLQRWACKVLASLLNHLRGSHLHNTSWRLPSTLSDDATRTHSRAVHRAWASVEASLIEHINDALRRNIHIGARAARMWECPARRGGAAPANLACDLAFVGW